MQKSNTKISLLEPIEKLPWGLLQTFLVAAEHLSIRKASDILRVNHSTVSRQLNQLESITGEKSFERFSQGLKLTSFGHRLLQYAQAMECDFNQLNAFIKSQNDVLAGSVHITLGDSLLPQLLTAVRKLHEEHPHLECQLSVSNSLARLDKGEADIALRITTQPPEHLVGHRLGYMQVAAYASRTLFDANNRKTEQDYPWVAWQLDEKPTATHELGKHQNQQRITCRVDSSSAMLAAIKAGVGAGFMLCCLGDREKDLVKINAASNNQNLPLWLLYHPQFRDSLKVQTVVKSIIAELSENK